MDAAKVALTRLREGYLRHSEGIDLVSDEEIAEYEARFLEAINDDLNMPVAMSVVWDVVKNSKKSKKLQELLLKFEEAQVLPENIQELVNQRIVARQEKNWAESDRLRDELINLGYSVKDTKDGIEVKKI